MVTTMPIFYRNINSLFSSPFGELFWCLTGGEEIRTLVPQKSDNLISSQARYDRFDTPPKPIIH